MNYSALSRDEEGNGISTGRHPDDSGVPLTI
jgi:hypothetical protein